MDNRERITIKILNIESGIEFIFIKEDGEIIGSNVNDKNSLTKALYEFKKSFLNEKDFHNFKYYLDTE